MNNTLKYTVVAAIVIVAAAFGIQSFISKSAIQNVDVSTLAPAAGDVTDQATQPVDAVIQAGTEASPVDGTASASDAGMPPQPAPVEGAVQAVDGAIQAVQEPAAGTESVVPADVQDPAAAPAPEATQAPAAE